MANKKAYDNAYAAADQAGDAIDKFAHVNGAISTATGQGGAGLVALAEAIRSLAIAVEALADRQV